jgi:hypothetical protein
MSLDMSKISNKLCSVTFFLLLVIAITILLIASTTRTPIPTWGGYLDVGIVSLIAFVGITIYQRNKNTARYDLSHHTAIYLLPLIFVGMWVYGEALDIHMLLPGVAWRNYFLLSILPHGIHLWKVEQR